MQSNPPAKQRILLIHGTGSYSHADNYDPSSQFDARWWQRGSPFWEKLGSKLPEGVSYFETNELGNARYKVAKGDSRDAFVWSGRNSERDRNRAAERLVKLLDALKRDNISVHIIAHSHGGTVAWYALRRLVSRVDKNPLSHVLSVTTLGTPFLSNGRYPFAWLWVASAALTAIFLLLPLSALWVSAREVGLNSFSNPEFANAVIGLRLNHSLTTLWLSMIAAVFGVYALVVGLGSVALSAWRGQAFALGATQNQEIASRLHILFSKDDEAINALQLATDMKLQAYPGNGELSISSLLAFCINQFITEIMRESSYGADRWLEFPFGVDPSPLESFAAQALDSQTETELATQADAAAEGMAGKLRTLFREGALRREETDVLISRTLQRVFSPHHLELIHNQYFASERVIQTVAQGIQCRTAPGDLLPYPLVPREHRKIGPKLASHLRIRWGFAVTGVLAALGTLLQCRFVDMHVDKSVPIVVAAKAFPESYVVAELLAQRLEQAGFTNVQRSFGRHSNRTLFYDLIGRKVNVYVEYTGTIYSMLEGPRVNPDAEPSYAKTDPIPMERWFAGKKRLDDRLWRTAVGGSLGYTSKYYLVMDSESCLFRELQSRDVIKSLKANAQNPPVKYELDLNKLAEVLLGPPENISKPLRLGLSSELLAADADGPAKIARAFGLRDEFDLRLRDLPHARKYFALKSGEVDMIDGYSTDPELNPDFDVRPIKSFSPFAQNAPPEFSLKAFGEDHGERNNPSTFEAIQIADGARDLLGDLAMRYEAFPYVSGETRFRRAALLEAVGKPVNEGTLRKVIEGLQTQMNQRNNLKPWEPGFAELVRKLVRESELHDVAQPWREPPSNRKYLPAP